MSSPFTIFPEAVNPLLVSKPAAKHFLIDVEPNAGGFALVLRSEDKAVVGKTNATAACLFRFNDHTGAHIPYIVAVAQSQNRAVLDQAAAQLIAFYSTPGSFGDRFQPLGECARAVLPIVLAVFGVAPRSRNGWTVGSVKDLPQRAVERAIQGAARALNNYDALADAVANAAGLKQPTEVVHRVAQILAQVGVPASFLA